MSRVVSWKSVWIGWLVGCSRVLICREPGLFFFSGARPQRYVRVHDRDRGHPKDDGDPIDLKKTKRMSMTRVYLFSRRVDSPDLGYPANISVFSSRICPIEDFPP